MVLWLASQLGACPTLEVGIWAPLAAFKSCGGGGGGSVVGCDVGI
jgi:hypothetical protein